MVRKEDFRIEARRNTNDSETLIAIFKNSHGRGLWQRLLNKRSIMLAQAKKKSLEKKILKRKQGFGVDVYETLVMGKDKDTRDLLRKCRYDIHQLNVEIYKLSRTIRNLSENTDNDESEDLIDPDTVAVGSIGFQRIIEQYSEKPRKSFTQKLFASFSGRFEENSFTEY